MMSASVEFNDMDYEMVHLSGAWASERYVKKQKTGNGYTEHPELKRTPALSRIRLSR